jgi:putative phosphoribosyl transferase
MLPRRFGDRHQAGAQLAERLREYQDRAETLVLGLPRGGVPVGFEVAHSLGAPLDVFVVRKLGVPGDEELAFGAIASGGVRVLNAQLVRAAGLTDETIKAVAEREQKELERRERIYRGGRGAQQVHGVTVILIDDGLATGATMLAAIRALRVKAPREIVVAVPVAAPDTCEELRPHANRIVCLITPYPFHSVGSWYMNVSETSDEEVRELLERADSKGVKSS